jgi:formylglycine-generating enzyme required for sulfatase activity
VRMLDGASVSGVFGWRAALATRTSADALVVLAGRDEPVELSLRTVVPVDDVELLRAGAPVPLRVECLRDGEPLALELAAGVPSGLACERTAYPRICSRENRLAPGASIDVDPGSYLVVARAPGREPQRLNVLVERRANVEAAIELVHEGALPPGFVHVPPGPFLEGGDAAAFQPRERRARELPGFFIARKELTNREWYEFVNDPATLARLAQVEPGAHLYLPQDDRVLARSGADGGFTWDVYSATSAESPALGLAWTDVRDYLAWRNARAEQRGEPWIYDLPSEAEWEKAARGVDGRAFPWGERFDPALTVCLVREAGYLLDAPGGYEPRDESPFGVLDMAGSREEWLRDVVEGSDPPRCRKRGGHWGSSVETVFRSASRGEASVARFASSQGVRLVARRR